MPSKFFYIVLKSRIPVNLAAGHLEVVGSNPSALLIPKTREVFWFSQRFHRIALTPVPGSGDFRCLTSENEYIQVSRGHDAFNERPGSAAEDPHH